MTMAFRLEVYTFIENHASFIILLLASF